MGKKSVVRQDDNATLWVGCPRTILKEVEQKEDGCHRRYSGEF